MDNKVYTGETNLQETLDILVKESKKQTFYMRICAIFCVIVLLAGMYVAPKICTAWKEFQLISSRISNIGIEEMIDNINDLVTESRDSVSLAGETLNEIDFTLLNDSINDLQDVISPLANFFNKFG